MNDQNKDLINQVNNLLNRYLQKERTVILAVVPANQDIATVEVLEVCDSSEHCLTPKHWKIFVKIAI